MAILNNIEQIVGKIINNESIPILSDVTTFEVILRFENNISNYGYKNKKAMEYFNKLIDFGNSHVVYTYFNQLFILNHKYYLNFSRAVMLSDIIYYNTELFNMVAADKENIDLILKRSSLKVVIKILKNLRIFNQIKHKKEIPSTYLDIDSILINCVQNNDDRVFKLILYLINDKNINIVLKNMSQNTKPKYFLKRIKWLNKHIDLKNHFDKLITIEPKVKDNNLIINEWLKTYLKIIKIYQNDKVLINSLDIHLSKYMTEDSAYEFYLELGKICYPKILTLINQSIFYHCNYLTPIQLKILINILKMGYKPNINVIFKIILYISITNFINQEQEQNKLKFEFMKLVTEIYGKKLYSYLQSNNQNFNYNNYNTYLDHTKIAYYGNYIPQPIDSNGIKINFVKSCFRIKIKKRSKIKKYSLINLSKNLQLELKTFKPNLNYPVLSQGSRNYQIIKQNFHSITPPTLYKSNKKIINPLLTLKADGIQVNRLPYSIKNLSSNLVKSEYIRLKDKELYLVFDINFSDMTYLERIIWLRQAHPMKLPEYYKVNNIKNLLFVIKQEGNLEREWIKKCKNDIIWYPKAFIKYTGDLDELYNLVFNNQFNPPYLNYPIDGLIVNNGENDFKIKPKKLHTIDLEYNNGLWYDTQNECEFKIINPYKIKLLNNTIYRCYPESNDIYVVKDEREDKIKPNSPNIIKNIRESYLRSNNEYYQKSTKITPDILQQIKQSRENELSFLQSLGLDKKKSILDLCSGKCYVSKNLHGFNSYTLIDKNPIMKHQNNFTIIKEDLTKYDLKDYQNYIWICLNGLWYWKDNFIENVKKYNPKELVFNVHSNKLTLWKCEESYLRKEENKIKYYFQWCHNKEREDVYLDKSILEDLINLGYHLVTSRILPEDTSLASKYELYYLRK